MQEVRIVAPSLSLEKKDLSKLKKAEEYFKSIGYTLTTGKYIFDKNKYYGCSSIKNRVNDLMDAFKDKNVKIIICANGGYNVNQILPFLDYNIIKNNPKMLIGYSDITALLNAITSKTNLITYYGPMLSGFTYQHQYTIEYFEKVLKNEELTINSSKELYDNQSILKNNGMIAINSGKTSGKVIGGNLCTLNLLQGTEYMPNLNDSILFIEDDADDFKNDVFLLEFDRNLESLLQSKNSNIKGIVFGRFELCSNMTIEKLKTLIKQKEKLKNIPIVFGADFGHTNPMFTIPIGGTCTLDIKPNNIKIEFKKSR